MYISAFTSIKEEGINIERNNKKSSHKDLPIWPLLLEKAYASYYSSYEALTHGNTLDMLQQCCGGPFQIINLFDKKDPEEYLEVIDYLLNEMRNGNVVSIGQLKQTQPMIPLYYKAEYCYSVITEE